MKRLWLFVILSALVIGGLLWSLVRLAFHMGQADVANKVADQAHQVREFLDSHVHIPKDRESP